MVRNLASELAHRGIAINAIAPGGTDSDMAAENAERHVHPDLCDLPPERTIKLGNALGRLAAPEEIAATVAFLVSADASYMTGYTLQVDGGRF
jgi:3-oxoacyl-[acyl-carrier protein] reductase